MNFNLSSLAYIIFIFCFLGFPFFVQAQDSDSALSALETPPPESPTFALITPISGVVVHGTILVIISPAFPSSVSSATLSSDALSFQSNFDFTTWSASWDSTTVPDGVYSFSVEVCVSSACENQSFDVSVHNSDWPESSAETTDEISPTPSSESPPASEPSSNSSEEPLPDVSEPADSSPKFSISPSNVPSAFYLNSDLQQLKSSGEPLLVSAGTYSAELTPIRSNVLHIQSNSFDLSSDGVFAQLSEINPPSELNFRGEWFVPFDGVQIDFGFPSNDFQIDLRYPSGSHLFACTSWQSDSQSCAVSWAPVALNTDYFSWSSFLSSVVFIWAQPGEVADPSRYPVPSFTILPSSAESSSFIFHSISSEDDTTSENEPVSLPRGAYSVRGTFPDFPIDAVRFQNVAIDHNGTFLTLQNFINPSSETDSGMPSEVVAISTDYLFRNGGFSIASSIEPRQVVSCDGWEISNPFSCPNSWQPYRGHSLSTGTTTIGFLPSELSSPDENVPIPIPDFNIDFSPEQLSLRQTILDLKSLHSNKKYFVASSALARFTSFTHLSGFQVDLQCDPARTTSHTSPIADTISPTPPALDADSLPSTTNSIAGFDDGLIPVVLPDIPSSDPYFFSNRWERDLPSLDNRREPEGTVSCDGVTLTNFFSEDKSPADTAKIISLGHVSKLKQRMLVENTTNTDVNRLVNVRFSIPASWVIADSDGIQPSEFYHAVDYYPVDSVSYFLPEAPEDWSDDFFIDDAFSTISHTTWGNSTLYFYDEDGHALGRYSFSDLASAGFSPRVVVSERDGFAVVETLLQVPIPAHSSVDLDPTFALSDTANFTSRWNGGAASDRIGTTVTTNGALSITLDTAAVKVVNIDNNSYSNDMLISAPRADVNGTDSGAIYLIKDIDKKPGIFDLANVNNFDVRWNGAQTNNNLGRTDGGYTAQLFDLDGNGYSNDLLISGAFVDFPSANAGVVYMILDIDKKKGSFDLNHTQNFDAVWTGSITTDELGFTQSSGQGVQVVNIDNNALANDLILTCALCNLSGRTDNGAVYIIRDINSKRGIFDLNRTAGSYWAVFGGSMASDFLGSLQTSDQGVFLYDLDNNGYTNDLIIGASNADANKAGSGSVYLIKNVDQKSGFFDLNVVSKFDVRWNGYIANDGLGNTSSSGQGVIIANLDGNAYANDMIISTPLGDAGGTNRGMIFMVLDIDKRSGINELSNRASYNARWVGATNTDEIGLNNGSGQGVQVVNLDGNSIANDLVVTSYLHNSISPAPARSDNGAVYIMMDVNTFVGNKILNNTANSGFTFAWYGSQASDFIGDSNFSNDTNSVAFYNLDGNLTANDMIITGSRINTSKADTGAVYLFRDVNAANRGIGGFDINNGTWAGRWAEDSTLASLSATRDSGEGYKIRNLDGNTYANDLILLAPRADVGGRTDNGAVTIIKDILNKTGTFDLNTSGSYDVRFYGGSNANLLGDTNFSGEGVRVVNLDNNAYSNDLVFTVVMSDGPAINTGSLIIIRDVDLLPPNSFLDMNNENNYYRKYWGAAAHNMLGTTIQSGEGTLILDVDNNGYANDILVRSSVSDVNSKADAGVIYLLSDLITSTIVGADYSFVLSLPSTGCSTGKGNISGGSSCERAWIESTDVNGAATVTGVTPEGQSTEDNTIPFFTIDNQSTSQTSFSIVLDLNQAYSAMFSLKASNTILGWESVCSGDTSSGCILLSTSPQSAGTAVYSTGTADLNIFFFGDFNAADVGRVDRNVDTNYA